MKVGDATFFRIQPSERESGRDPDAVFAARLTQPGRPLNRWAAPGSS